MAKRIDLTGNKYEKLTVIGLSYRKGKHTYWKCKCDCGNEKIICASNLTSSHTRSCGCRSFKKSVSQRFWEKVIKKESCWEWSGSPSKAGYGTLSINKIPINAHRISYEIHIGKIPENMCVCHKCDNRICVNPDHFFLGTKKDNMEDKRLKKRHAYGEKTGNSKLTDEIVLYCRFLYENGFKLSEMSKFFNIGCAPMRNAIKGRSWKHI